MARKRGNPARGSAAPEFHAERVDDPSPHRQEDAVRAILRYLDTDPWPGFNRDWWSAALREAADRYEGKELVRRGAPEDNPLSRECDLWNDLFDAQAELGSIREDLGQDLDRPAVVLSCARRLEAVNSRLCDSLDQHCGAAGFEKKDLPWWDRDEAEETAAAEA